MDFYSKVNDLERKMIEYNHKNSIESIMLKTIEESSELIQSLTKYLLFKQSFSKNIIEEIIDLEIMIHQIKFSIISNTEFDFEIEKFNKIVEYMNKHHLKEEKTKIVEINK